MKDKVTAPESAGEPRVALDEIVQRGAERMLAEALEAEVEQFLSVSRRGGSRGSQADRPQRSPAGS